MKELLAKLNTGGRWVTSAAIYKKTGPRELVLISKNKAHPHADTEIAKDKATIEAIGGSMVIEPEPDTEPPPGSRRIKTRDKLRRE